MFSGDYCPMSRRQKVISRRVLLNDLSVEASDGFQDILQAYSRVRVPRANFVQSFSKTTGDIYDSYVPGETKQESIEEKLVGQWDSVWFHDLDEDVKKAMDILGW